jgi:hypothetical protein
MMPPNEVGPQDTTPEGTDNNTTSADQSTDTHIIGDRPRSHITVAGPGRCLQCSFHVGTQGHRDGCDGSSGAIAADRYRAGNELRRSLCITCGINQHSAGRPRCASCHSLHEGRRARWLA